MKNLLSRIPLSALFRFLLTCGILTVALSSEASHYRYGNISWRKITKGSYEFKVKMGFRSSYNVFNYPKIGSAVPTNQFLEYGDGTKEEIILNVTSVNVKDDWFYGEVLLRHGYTTPGTYIASFKGVERVYGLQNVLDKSGFYVSSNINTTDVNNSPVCSMPPMVNAQTNSTSIIPISFTDPDGDPLTYRLATKEEMGTTSYSVPLGAVIDPHTGALRVTTNSTSTGNIYTIGVIASDGKTNVMTDFLIKVVPISNPPQFDYGITPMDGFTYEVAPNQLVKFNVKAFDIDLGDKVSLSLVGVPLGSTYFSNTTIPTNTVSSTFSWTPSTYDMGSYVLYFTAEDLSGSQTFSTVKINVSLKPKFDVPPTPAYQQEFAVKPGQLLTFPLQATDPEATDIVKISNTSNNLIATMDLTMSPFGQTSSAVFSWIPSLYDWGEHILEFTATDTHYERAIHQLGVVVNNPPFFISTVPSINELAVSKPFTYQIQASDANIPQGDKLELVATGLPSWLTLVDNGNGTGVLSGTPSSTDQGSFTIRVYVEDIYHHALPDGIPYQEFTINVVPCSVSLNITNSTICTGTKVALAASGTDKYSWLPVTGLTSASLANVTASPALTTLYTVTGTVTSTGCKASKAVLNTVNPKPTITVSPTSSNECTGASALLKASGANAYSWLPIAGLDITDQASVTATPAASITYTVTGTLTASGCSSIKSIVVKVNPKPTVSASPTTSSVCAGISTSLTASGANTYAWAPTTGLTPATGSIISATPSVTTTYTVTGTLTATGCKSISTVSITVKPKPTVTINPTAKSICSGQSTQLTASGAHLYNWTPNIGILSQTSAIAQVSPPFSMTYSVTGTSTITGCSNLKTVVLTLNPIPFLSVNTSAATICAGQSTLLSVTGATTYLWSPVNGLNNTKTSTVTSSPAVSTTYTVTGTSASGCSSTQKVVVTVNDKPAVTIDAISGTICNGDGKQLTASGANSYSWSPASYVDDPNLASVMTRPLTTTIFTVTGTRLATGCTATKTATVTVGSSIPYFVPDANYRAALKALYPSCFTVINGQDMLDLCCAGQQTNTQDVRNLSIQSLEGFQYFKNILYLLCDNNQLTSLPPLPNSLLSLQCNVNQIKSLPTLPYNLRILGCAENQISSLPSLPIWLTDLNCGRNSLTTLPGLPSNLIYLTTGSNKLTELPSLPSYLRLMDCSNNQLTKLPELPNSLQTIYCGLNQITELPALPTSLTIFDCRPNLISKMPALPNLLTDFYCSNNKLESIPTLPPSLQYFYCSNNLLKGLPDLPNSVIGFDCSNNCIPNPPAAPNRTLIKWNIDPQNTNCGVLRKASTEELEPSKNDASKESKSISISPNPAHDMLQVDAEGIKVFYNSTGVEVYRTSATLIDVSNFVSGLYQIHVLDGARIQKAAFIKN
ncbi:MAG: putative Ig domain-containing protein [Cytophagales bacterium]|nr:putative Ig domain-containing protein [Cytophagales bacterium]